MVTEVDYKIRTALPADRSRLANLIHFGAYTHQHLDWKPPLDWIGSKPYLVADQGSDIAAALACPPELPEIAWIRLFAVSSLTSLEEAWKSLLSEATAELAKYGKVVIAAISLQSWFNELLEASQFEQTDNVVVLMWENPTMLAEPRDAGITVRPMIYEDLDLITQIDHDAFDSIWKNSLESLSLAFEQSSHASVAELKDEIVGYQFSTTSSMGGHLARLAVKKSIQGKGIGYSLVHQLLSQFSKLGVPRVTVNTQKNNSASLSLYSKAGFNLTGESYRVYQRTIGG